MLDNIILSNFTLEQLADKISENIVGKFQNISLQEGNLKQAENSDPILTRKETAALLQTSLVSLHKWTKEGKIQALKISGRIRYRKSDVMKSLKVIEFKK